MKKLRMIVTSVIVLAIVGGAFAFKTKAGSFCILTGTTSGTCTTFKKDFRITTSGTLNDYMLYPDWDGTQTLCTPNGTNKCTVQIKLVGDGI